MKISQIIEYETSQDRDKTVARLYLENGWYRAYEWSAYLIHNYPNNLEDDKRLRPTHRYVKECDDSIISVGLKLNMINKFLPNAQYKIEDEYIDVTIKLSINENSSNDLLSKWKESVKIQTPQTIGKVYSKPFSMTDILKEILGYRMEHTTADEDRTFLYGLKEKCYSLI